MKHKEIIRGELIGLHVKITECRDPKWINKSGIIVDETKNTLMIKINNKNKRIIKKIAKFELNNNGKKIILNGSKIAYRSEDRIKKAR